MKVRYLFLFVFCIVTSGTLSAQYYLQLKKRNKVIHTYTSGDKIKFKLKDDNFFYDQMITGISDSTIKFHLLDIALRDIETVRIQERNSYGLDLVSGAAITAGVFFLAIDQINQLFVQDEGLGPSSETLIISGTLVGSGLLLRLFKRKKFRLKSARYRLSVTDFYQQGR